MFKKLLRELCRYQYTSNIKKTTKTTKIYSADLITLLNSSFHSYFIQLTHLPFVSIRLLLNKAPIVQFLQSFGIKNRQAIRGMSHTQHTICPIDIDQLLHSILQDDNSAMADEFSAEVPPASLQSEPMEDESSSNERPTKEDSEFASQSLYTPGGRRSHKIKKNPNLASLPHTANKERKQCSRRLTEVQKLHGIIPSQECIFLEEESSKGSLTSLDGVLGKSGSLPSQLKQALLEERQNIEKTLASASSLSLGKAPQNLPSIHYQTLYFKKYSYTAHFWVVESPQAQKDSAINSRTRNREKIEPFSVWARQKFHKDGMEIYFNNALSRLNSSRLFGMIMELANMEEVTAKDMQGHPLIYQDKEANYSPRCPVWSAGALKAMRMRKRAQLQRRRYIQVEDEWRGVKVEEMVGCA